MSDFDELEGRIASALDRIGQGAKAIEAQAIAAAEQAAQMTVAPEVDPEEIDLLKKQLEDERLANAQLETRLNTIRDRQEASAKKHRETVSHLNAWLKMTFHAIKKASRGRMVIQNILAHYGHTKLLATWIGYVLML